MYTFCKGSHESVIAPRKGSPKRTTHLAIVRVVRELDDNVLPITFDGMWSHIAALAGENESGAVRSGACQCIFSNSSQSGGEDYKRTFAVAEGE